MIEVTDIELVRISKVAPGKLSLGSTDFNKGPAFTFELEARNYAFNLTPPNSEARGFYPFDTTANNRQHLICRNQPKIFVDQTEESMISPRMESALPGMLAFVDGKPAFVIREAATFYIGLDGEVIRSEFNVAFKSWKIVLPGPDEDYLEVYRSKPSLFD